MSVCYMTHPLIKHKITLMRNEKTSTKEFRNLVEEVAMLMGYEALSDLQMIETTVKTPIEETKQPVIAGKPLYLFGRKNKALSEQNFRTIA